MVTFGILRVEAQTWTFDNRDKHDKILCVYIYISFVVYNTCLDQLFSSKLDAFDINNGFCFVEDIHIIK